MTRSFSFAVALIAGLACAGPAWATELNPTRPAADQQAPVPGPAPTGPLTEVKVGYLGLNNDVRYHPQVAYTRIQISPAIKPVEGARMGLEDLAIIDEAVNIKITLDEQMANDANDAIAKLKAMVAAGENFAILDLPGDIVAQVAPALNGLPMTVINATAPQDALRNACYPNVLHSGASDRMIGDTYAQFLRHRNWNKVLLLVGDQPRDKEEADSFVQSAQRLGVTVVDRRTFTLSTDPANREQNNSMLVTGNADYDVVFIADSLGEYARYLNYSTLLPRPVIGSTGLTASEWAWSWDRDGATQVTLKFQRESEGNREMSGADWSTWIAAKSIATAYAKARSSDPVKIDAFMRGKRFTIDGSKGYRMDFRPWDHQLRMPMVLHTADAVTEAAPFPEFLHATNVLDTLGTDEPESPCKVPQ
jgi:ABC transporter substrate binding protein (PQQ-dependent alcohol dehydrogenase system)